MLRDYDGKCPKIMVENVQRLWWRMSRCDEGECREMMTENVRSCQRRFAIRSFVARVRNLFRNLSDMHFSPTAILLVLVVDS